MVDGPTIVHSHQPLAISHVSINDAPQRVEVLFGHTVPWSSPLVTLCIPL